MHLINCAIYFRGKTLLPNGHNFNFHDYHWSFNCFTIKSIVFLQICTNACVIDTKLVYENSIHTIILQIKNEHF